MSTIYTFYTISEVLKFERLVEAEGIDVKLMPVPRHLSTSCGTCARARGEDYDRIKALAEENQLDFEGVYPDVD